MIEKLLLTRLPVWHPYPVLFQTSLTSTAKDAGLAVNIKIGVICFYLMIIYWASQHFPGLKMIFYPTLGAFSYLFISRSFHFSDFDKIIAGSSAASLISSSLFMYITGIAAFIAAILCTIVLIRKFHLNAPPILAIALIPFFSQPVNIWSLPLSVLVSLTGLLLILSVVELLPLFAARLARPQREGKHKNALFDTTIDS
jgi:hypothetical protein